MPGERTSPLHEALEINGWERLIKTAKQFAQIVGLQDSPSIFFLNYQGDQPMASLTYDDAAHALRRLGFGGPRQEIEALVAKGREGAIDYLINFEQINNDAFEAQLARISLVGIDQIKRWWFARMALSR